MKKTTISQERLMQIIQAPYVSEKGTFLGEMHNQTVFKVLTDATKQEIKAAVELLWKDQKIEVESVQTLNVKGKKKRFGRFMGSTNGWKKAIVSIKSGQELSFTDFSKAEAK
jgi:large subunit ribosomal protein L23